MHTAITSTSSTVGFRARPTSGWRGLSSWMRSAFGSEGTKRGADEDDAETERSPLWLLKMEMFQAVDGCAEVDRTKLSAAIARSRTGKDLWMIRSAMFQAIALSRGERHARDTINALLPLFLNWVPDRQRVKI